MQYDDFNLLANARNGALVAIGMMVLLIVAALCGTLDAAKADTALDLLKTKLTQTSYSTDISMEFLSKYFPRETLLFVRLRCEIFDDSDKSLGVFTRDYSGSYARAVLFPIGSFWRPSMHLDRIDGADHATCRFATKDDPLPTVGTDDIEIQLDSVREIEIANHSAFYVGSVDFKCRGGGKETDYQQIGAIGIPPGGSTPRHHIENDALECVATGVRVRSSPDMNTPVGR